MFGFNFFKRKPEPQPRPITDYLDDRHEFLVRGQKYRVIKEFIDHDREVHPVGEEWIFLGKNFVPYHDGMSFFVSPDGAAEVQIRLQWIPEEQAEILDNLATYIAVV